MFLLATSNGTENCNKPVMFINKEQTKRGLSEHTSDAEYQEAVKIAQQSLLRLREQLQWRPKR